MQVSVPNRDGPRATALEHPIEDVAAEDHLGRLGVRIPRSKPIADHRFVSEEGVLHASLLVVSRLLLPLTTPDFPYSCDRAIASAGSFRSRRCLSRRNDDFRAACRSGIVDRDRVLGGVCREA